MCELPALKTLGYSALLISALISGEKPELLNCEIAADDKEVCDEAKVLITERFGASLRT